MRAPISVVMAVWNAERVLPRQLAVLGEALAEGLLRELILVDGGSSDATPRIAAEAAKCLKNKSIGIPTTLAFEIVLQT